jgi:hypothetical protein
MQINPTRAQKKIAGTSAKPKGRQLTRHGESPLMSTRILPLSRLFLLEGALRYWSVNLGAAVDAIRSNVGGRIVTR